VPPCVVNSSNARRTREADSGRLTHAMNLEGRRVGVLLASWKRVGRRVVGVLVPEEALGGMRRLEKEERLDRIPERMATPMVPQPRTVRVSDSGVGSILFYLWFSCCGGGGGIGRRVLRGDELCEVGEVGWVLSIVGMIPVYRLP